MKTFVMLHGINHNMFGKRDPAQYGTITLDEIDSRLQALGRAVGQSRSRSLMLVLERVCAST